MGASLRPHNLNGRKQFPAVMKTIIIILDEIYIIKNILRICEPLTPQPFMQKCELVQEARADHTLKVYIGVFLVPLASRVTSSKSGEQLRPFKPRVK
jgi:hypothetical protein